MPRARDYSGAAGVRGPRGSPKSRAASAAVAAVLVGGQVVACTPTDDSEPPGPADPASATLTVTTAGAGRMGDDTRAEVESEVSDALANYVVKGFLGDYPRGDFVEGLADFSSRATKFAAADIDVLTAARFEDASTVTATSLDARLFFLVHGRVVVGASAFVDFGFDVDEDGQAKTARLTGRFTFGHTDDGWQVFGYDLLRDDSDALPTEASS